MSIPTYDPKTETRADAIARFERDGMLAPECSGCQEVYEATDKMPWEVWAPRHKASDRCESGKRPHCTCDRCF